MKILLKMIVPLFAVLTLSIAMANEDIKPNLSKEDMETLLGTWKGKAVYSLPPLTEAPIQFYRFEMSEKGEFTGIVSMPETGLPDAQITDMEINDGIFSFKIANGAQEFKGKLTEKEIVGELTSPMRADIPFEITLVKEEYKVPPVYKLDLPKEIKDQLAGKWNGKLGIMPVVFRFELSKNGDFLGFVDKPTIEISAVPITDAKMSDGKLVLRFSIDEIKGKISADKIVGEWTGMGMTTTFSLKKE